MKIHTTQNKKIIIINFAVPPVHFLSKLMQTPQMFLTNLRTKDIKRNFQ